VTDCDTVFVRVLLYTNILRMFALRSFSSVANRTLHRHLKLQGTSRFFSISSTRRAAEVPDILAPEVKEGLKSSPTFRKFVKSPAALAALKELAEVMHKLGLFTPHAILYES